MVCAIRASSHGMNTKCFRLNIWSDRFPFHIFSDRLLNNNSTNLCKCSEGIWQDWKFTTPVVRVSKLKTCKHNAPCLFVLRKFVQHFPNSVRHLNLLLCTFLKLSSLALCDELGHLLVQGSAQALDPLSLHHYTSALGRGSPVLLLRHIHSCHSWLANGQATAPLAT